MIEEFKQWLTEIQEAALAAKREQASAAGDVNKWKTYIWKSTDKNRDIKARFIDEGALRGYRSRPSYKTGAGEWLYDFVWREFDENNQLLRVVLTMKIEVSESKKSSLMYDLHKLLQADSEYKIFVFQTKTEVEVLAAMEALKIAAQHYLSKVESKFLLCGWSTQLNLFSFDNFEQEIAPRPKPSKHKLKLLSGIVDHYTNTWLPFSEDSAEDRPVVVSIDSIEGDVCHCTVTRKLS